MIRIIKNLFIKKKLTKEQYLITMYLWEVNYGKKEIDGI